MVCQWGPLRAERELRDVYIPSAGANEDLHADQRKAQGEADIRVTK
jgi:hypothetical protein